MISPLRPSLCLCLFVATAALAMPAQAQSMRGWHHDPFMDSPDRRAPAQPQRQVQVETWRTADAPALLGHGRVKVSAHDAAPPPDDDAPPAAAPIDALPVFEAAVVDRLAAAGYDVADSQAPAQIADVTISRATVVPPEAPHRPISGEMSVGVSTRGTSDGMALAVDLTKPAAAIVETRIDVRIRDAATGRTLWEGHARSQAREGEREAGADAWAQRLARALFAHFPEGTVVETMPGVE